MPFTAPGDEVEIAILKTSKNYSEGECVQLIRQSPIRVDPQCPVFGKCGGCTWQHLPYSLQFETKKKGLIRALTRAGVDLTSVQIEEFQAPNAYHYRNRIQLHGNPSTQKVGFYARARREIVPIESCPITRSEINAKLPELAILGFQKFSEEFKLEIEITAAGSVRHAFNERHAAFGFRQVNDEQNGVLQNWIKQNLPRTTLLLDLYGGSGNLSLPMIKDYEEILCVDTTVPITSPSPHFRFEKKDIASWSKKAESQKFYSKSTAVILDPPREGMGSHFNVIHEKISRFDVKCIALVGCDVDSFVRDSAQFIKKGYRLAKVGVLDLFPQTPHVESLALFFK